MLASASRPRCVRHREREIPAPQTSQHVAGPTGADSAWGLIVELGREGVPAAVNRSNNPRVVQLADRLANLADQLRQAGIGDEHSRPTRSISSVFDSTRGRFSTSSFSSSNALGERWASRPSRTSCLRRDRACSQQIEFSRAYPGTRTRFAGPLQNSRKVWETVKTGSREIDTAYRSMSVELQSFQEKGGVMRQVKRVVFVSDGNRGVDFRVTNGRVLGHPRGSTR